MEEGWNNGLHFMPFIPTRPLFNQHILQIKLFVIFKKSIFLLSLIYYVNFTSASKTIDYCLNLKRCIFPEAVFGISSINSMILGYL